MTENQVNFVFFFNRQKETISIFFARTQYMNNLK